MLSLLNLVSVKMGLFLHVSITKCANSALSIQVHGYVLVPVVGSISHISYFAELAYFFLPEELTRIQVVVRDTVHHEMCQLSILNMYRHSPIA